MKILNESTEPLIILEKKVRKKTAKIQQEPP